MVLARSVDDEENLQGFIERLGEFGFSQPEFGLKG